MSNVLLVPDHPDHRASDWMRSWHRFLPGSHLFQAAPYMYLERDSLVAALIEAMEALPEPRVLVAEGLSAVALGWALADPQAVPVEGALFVNPDFGGNTGPGPVWGYGDLPLEPPIADGVIAVRHDVPQELAQRAHAWAHRWGAVFAMLGWDDEAIAAFQLLQFFCMRREATVH